MIILFWSIVVFAIAFAIHITLWKIRLPKRQTKVLLTVFIGTLLAFLIIFYFLHGKILFGIKTPDDIPQLIHIFLFVISLTLAYMITYSALEADSPSLVMVLEIHKAGDNGLPIDSFNKAMTNDVLIIPRINDLTRDKLAYIENNKFKLTNKGKLFAAIFSTYRKILKIDRKGG